MTFWGIWAILLGASLMSGETIRSWGQGRNLLIVLDDFLIGVPLVVTAILMKNPTLARHCAFAASFAATAGMLCGSFFGKLVDVARPALAKRTRRNDWGSAACASSGASRKIQRSRTPNRRMLEDIAPPDSTMVDRTPCTDCLRSRMGAAERSVTTRSNWAAEWAGEAAVGRCVDRASRARLGYVIMEA